jgi:hypothetical protein
MLFSAFNKEEIESLQKSLQHEKEKKKSRNTYRLRHNAESLSLAQRSQMAAPQCRKMEQGAEASDGCAMAQRKLRLAPARGKNL